ncbi:MAG: hypothetical protein HC895_08060 [Leptolyngbyaceae cyanobacterium SM1_3_5]|nr:hypothetical protein [Leptolyngbyaceae cyanobacterium SM1_3_5]
MAFPPLDRQAFCFHSHNQGGIRLNIKHDRKLGFGHQPPQNPVVTFGISAAAEAGNDRGLTIRLQSHHCPTV